MRAFLAGDPGEYRDEAQAALANLEERTFDAARDADTIPDFEAFLNDFPDSEHAIAARGRIAELQSMTPTEPVEGETDPNALPEEATPVDPDFVPPGSTTGATPADPALAPRRSRRPRQRRSGRADELRRGPPELRRARSDPRSFSFFS